MNSKQFLVLEASAGSGKTFALALRYVYLLLEGAKMGEILALTFTNKAVDEMRHRVGLFLSILGGQSGDEDKKKDLLDALYREYGWEANKVLSLAPKLLESYWREGAKIQTIDAFLNAILKRFCWYVGIPYHFEMSDLNREEIEEQFLKLLSPKQKERIIFFCLHHRRSLDFLLEKIDFVRERFMDSLEGIEVVEGQIQIFEAQALQVAKEIQALVRNSPLDPSDEALKAVEFETFIELLDKGRTWISKGTRYKGFKKLNLDEEIFLQLQEAVLAVLLLREKEFLTLLKDTCNLYQEARDKYSKKQNQLSFSDVMLKTYELLCKENLSKDFFYFRLDDRISHILLDEFQDTSVMQYKILFPIIEEILSGNGRVGKRSFFAVGDKKQSIYQFRGGYGKLLDIIKGLSKEICVENLPANYRSRSQIVDFVNEVFRGQIKDYFDQESRKEGGFVRICDVQSMESGGNGKEKIFESVSSLVREFLKQGVSLDDIAILTFTNSDVMNLGDYLKREFSPVSTKESIILPEKRDAQILLGSIQYSLAHTEESKTLEEKKLIKLLGRGLDDEVKILPFSKEEEIGAYIYRAMHFYGLNSKVAKQVLEIACQSKDMEEFFINVRSSKDSKEEQDGLKILTIHASKGLEFEHLIVLDRLGSPQKHEEPFFCQYNQRLQGKIFMSDTTKQRAQIDEGFAQVLEEEKIKREEGQKNLLYVAFTRACQSLTIVPIKKTRAESEFKCIGLVDEDEILFPQMRGSLEIEKKNIQPIHSQKEIFVSQEKFGRQEGFVQKEKQDLGFKNILALKKGEAFHKALELFLGYGVSGEGLKHFLRNTYGIWIDEVDLDEIFASFEKVEEVLDLNFGSSRIKSEVSFIQDFKLHRIDCLLECYDENQRLSKVVILDYKSGGKQEKYRDQVQEYVEFAKTQYEGVKVEGYLLYLQSFELVRL